jgi:hypothetical protein
MPELRPGESFKPFLAIEMKIPEYRHLVIFGAVPMTSLARKRGVRHRRCRLTVRSAQAMVAVVGLAFGVVVTAFRFSVQARLYSYKVLVHGMAERTALKQADAAAEGVRKCLELARLIARDSRLDAEGYTFARSPSLAKKHPRLEAARRQTLTLSEMERRDVLEALEDTERILVWRVEHARERCASEARLKQSYEHAALYPWISPDPDSPWPVP